MAMVAFSTMMTGIDADKPNPKPGPEPPMPNPPRPDETSS